MSKNSRRTSFKDEEEIAIIKTALKQMVDNETFNTPASFSANTDRYPDNLMPFIDKHLEYLRTHKGLNPQHYVSNLMLMTRIR